MMKVLIIGSGGREHALAWKAAQSHKVKKVFVAPGNAGTTQEQKVENVAIGASDINALVDFARQEGVGLAIVGPEAPLVKGITEAFNRAGLRCFGPTGGASQLEGSKVFCKDFLARHNIPTAAYKNFTEIESAKAYIRGQGMPIVIKADGLAAGKGVIIAQSEAEAFSAVEGMLIEMRLVKQGIGWSSRNMYKARRPVSSSWSTEKISCRWPHRKITRPVITGIQAQIQGGWAPIHRPR